jgi:hypothetical protein
MIFKAPDDDLTSSLTSSITAAKQNLAGNVDVRDASQWLLTINANQQRRLSTHPAVC